MKASLPIQSAPDIAYKEESIEQIAPGLTRSWLMDKRVVLFRPGDVSRATVDAWFNCVMRTMEEWPKGQVYLAVHDLSARHLLLTPHARKRSEELLPLSAGAPGYAALVLSPTFMAQIIRLFLRAQRQQGNENQVFFSMHEAMAWLMRKAVEGVPATQGK
ncbi:MAG TPA: hypothetical protein VKQ72_02035 [Aggregatilineales bacterium]|nr:hypothetical protein [Aggregatilineales bacterium]